LERPAIPIDMAAFSYHWSVLKITRRTRFFSGLARETDFLAVADDLEALEAFEAVSLEEMFFGIGYHPLHPHRGCTLAAAAARSQREQGRTGSTAHPGSRSNLADNTSL
jgi:hypothetical protein